jgi:hypothetical protein
LTEGYTGPAQGDQFAGFNQKKADISYHEQSIQGPMLNDICAVVAKVHRDHGIGR